mgnify:CR=1 FL=1
MQKRGNVFSNTINLGQQKAVVLGDELFVYTSNTTAYKTSTAPDKYNWSKVNVSNLPSDVKLTSAVEYNNALYMVTKAREYSAPPTAAPGQKSLHWETMS